MNDDDMQYDVNGDEIWEFEVYPEEEPGPDDWWPACHALGLEDLDEIN